MKLLDQILVLLALAWYILGSVVLVFKALRSRPGERRSVFYCGQLALLPESWQRWCLGEERRAAGRTKISRLRQS